MKAFHLIRTKVVVDEGFTFDRDLRPGKGFVTKFAECLKKIEKSKKKVDGLIRIKECCC